MWRRAQTGSTPGSPIKGGTGRRSDAARPQAKTQATQEAKPRRSLLLVRRDRRETPEEAAVAVAQTSASPGWRAAWRIRDGSEVVVADAPAPRKRRFRSSSS